MPRTEQQFDEKTNKAAFIAATLVSGGDPEAIRKRLIRRLGAEETGKIDVEKALVARTRWHEEAFSESWDRLPATNEYVAKELEIWRDGRRGIRYGVLPDNVHPVLVRNGRVTAAFAQGEIRC